MNESLFSASWYRVAELRPRLRAHARIHRHVYRGEPWYVLEDVANQRVHRFTPATQTVIGLMDGSLTVKQLWEVSIETLGDASPTQDEMIRLLSQLHSADVLQCDVPPDTAELLERFEKYEQQQWKSRLLSPFSIRVPLFDPDKVLRRLVPRLRPFLDWKGALVWLAVVLPALILAGVHWSELTNGLLDHLFAPQTLVLIWLVFPLIKVLHELGHGFATRLFGGEVHDMGVMFLVFTPVPYVDASSASAFPERTRRALVSAAGMIVEVFLAALAFYLWLAIEPGLVRSIAYNVMFVAGVTTVTFNANPLLRFDGYYILSDVLEIPNLRQRANDYVIYLVERWAFGSRESMPPEASRTERPWLVAFAVAAFAYRMLVTALIMLFVLHLSFAFGMLLVLVSVVGFVGMPLAQGVRALVRGPRLANVRRRAVTVVVATLAFVLLLVLAVPVPLRTRAEGVVWIPEEAIVRAEAAGFVERIEAKPGSAVHAGDLLFTCRDPEADALVVELRSRLRVLEVRHDAAMKEDRAKAAVFDEQIKDLEQRLARALERRASLAIRAGADGTFVVPTAEDLPGRFVEQGDVLAHIVDRKDVKVRAVVRQEDLELVRDRLRGAVVRRVEAMGEVLPATLTRLVPAASPELPAVALGTQGGGSVPVDPRDQRGTSAVSGFFQAELEMGPPPSDTAVVGGRVYVRFDHGYEPLVVRGYRALRQLFLARLSV